MNIFGFDQSHAPLAVYDAGLLDEACALARQGRGRFLWFSDPEGQELSALLAGWRAGQKDLDYLELRLDADLPSPYAPFFDILRSLAPLRAPGFLEELLERTPLYHRHRTLFRVCLGLDDPSVLSAVEDVLTEEIIMERQVFQASLAALLAAMSAERLVVVWCRGLQAMSEDACLLLRDESFLRGCRLLVLCEPDCENPGPQLSAYLQELSATGQFIKLSAQEYDPAEEEPALHEPDRLGIELLLHCLCFQTVLHRLKGLEPSLVLAIWRARCHEAAEDYEEALLALQSILVDASQGDIASRCSLLRLSARQYRYLNDPEMAYRLGIQAFELAWESGDQQEIARADFVQFFLFSIISADPAQVQIIEDRLDQALVRLGWVNHRAFFLAQGSSVMRCFRSKGARPALERSQEAIDLSGSIANSRRLGTAWHAKAMVWLAMGELRKADLCFRRALREIGSAVLPQELARIHNGYGFSLFVSGRYQQAMAQHNRALNLLKLSRHFEEGLVTGVNVARIQLFSHYPDQARKLLESIQIVLNAMGIMDLPFMERETIDALHGIACAKDGQMGAAREINRRVHANYYRQSKNPHAVGYRLWLNALINDQYLAEDAQRRAWADCLGHCQANPEELGYLLPPIAADFAFWLEKRGDRQGSREIWLVARRFGEQRPWPHWDLEVAKAQLGEGPMPELPRLARIALDPHTILDSVQQDVRIRAWRRTARASVFLRSWQETLAGEAERSRLLVLCRAMIKRNFLVDEVLFDEPEPFPPELPARFGPRQAWLESADLAGTGYRTASWLPRSRADYDAPGCFIASNRGGVFYSQDDHRVILIALHYLDSTLLVRQRSRELELRKRELEKANARLSEALEQLTLTQGQLVQSEKLAALGGMVAGVAHEINTPLGIAVTGVSHLVEKVRLFEKKFQANEMTRSDLANLMGGINESSEIVLRNLYRADSLVHNFKQVATDQTSENQRSFELLEYLEEVLSSLRPKWRKTAIEVELQGESGLQIDSYPGALAQIVTNLTINALVHAFGSEQQGRVLWTAKAGPRDGVDLVCADSGAGIPKANLGRIFDPFFTTRREAGGTGLGLHIVFNLVHRVLGGTIRCESESGKGTRFIIWFPRVAPRRAEGDA